MLDAAKGGERFIITRGGKRIAEIGPASASNGAALVDYLRSHAVVDAEFAGDVAAIRAAAGVDESPWRDV